MNQYLNRLPSAALSPVFAFWSWLFFTKPAFVSSALALSFILETAGSAALFGLLFGAAAVVLLHYVVTGRMLSAVAGIVLGATALTGLGLMYAYAAIVGPTVGVIGAVTFTGFGLVLLAFAFFGSSKDSIR